MRRILDLDDPVPIALPEDPAIAEVRERRAEEARIAEVTAALEFEAAERAANAAQLQREAAERRAVAARDIAAARAVSRKLKRDRASRRSRAIDALYALDEHGTLGGYTEVPPVEAMVAVFEGEGYELVDGAPDLGAILAAPIDGPAGRARMHFEDPDGGELYLHAAFYRMPSGRFETIAYAG